MAAENPNARAGINRAFGVKLTSPFANAYGTILNGGTTTADHLMGLWFNFRPRHNGVLVPGDGVSVQLNIKLAIHRPAPEPSVAGSVVSWVKPTENATPYGYTILVMVLKSSPAPTMKGISGVVDHDRIIGRVDGVGSDVTSWDLATRMSFSPTCGRVHRVLLRAMNRLIIKFRLAGLIMTGLRARAAPADVALVQAVISGGDRSVGKDVPLVAVAASVPRGKCPATATLTHEWRLVPLGEDFASPNVIFKAGPSAELKSVPLAPSSATPNPIANFNPGGSYTLHLKTIATCPDGTVAEDQASATITVLDKPLPVVKIDLETSQTKNPLGLRPTRSLAMRCRSSVASDPNFPNVAVQGWVAPNNEPELASLLTYLNNGTTKAENTLNFTPDKRPALVLNKEYILRCYASYPGAPPGEVVFDEIRVRLLGPPEGGKCTIAPPEGWLLEDTFTVTCSDWIPGSKEPSGNPLSYSLRIVTPEGRTILVPNQPETTMPDLVLPVGNPVNLIATVTDANGGWTDVPLTAIVKARDDPCAAYKARKAKLDAELSSGKLSRLAYDKRILQAATATSRQLQSTLTASGKPLLKNCTNMLIDDTCASTPSAKTTPDKILGITTVSAVGRLAAGVLTNETEIMRVYACAPEVDPCEIPDDIAAEKDTAMAEALGAAISSDEWSPDVKLMTKNEVQTTNGKSESGMASLLENLIKGPATRAAECDVCGQGFKKRGVTEASITTGKICFTNIKDYYPVEQDQTAGVAQSRVLLPFRARLKLHTSPIKGIDFGVSDLRRVRARACFIPEIRDFVPKEGKDGFGVAAINMKTSPYSPIYRPPGGGVGTAKLIGGFLDISVLGQDIQGISESNPIIMEIPFPATVAERPPVVPVLSLLFWNSTAQSWETCGPPANMALGDPDDPKKPGDIFQRGGTWYLRGRCTHLTTFTTGTLIPPDSTMPVPLAFILPIAFGIGGVALLLGGIAVAKGAGSTGLFSWGGNNPAPTTGYQPYSGAGAANQPYPGAGPNQPYPGAGPNQPYGNQNLGLTSQPANQGPSSANQPWSRPGTGAGTGAGRGGYGAGTGSGAGSGAGSGNPAFVPRNVQAFPAPGNPGSGSTVVAWDRPDVFGAGSGYGSGSGSGSGSPVAKYEIWSVGPDGTPGQMLGSAPPDATSIALSSAAFAGAGAGALILVRAVGPQGQAGMSPPVAANGAGAGAGSGNPAFMPRNVQAYPSPNNPGSTVVAWDKPEAASAGSGSGSAVAKYEIWSAGPDGMPGQMLGSAPPNATSIALSSAAVAGAGAGALLFVRAVGRQGQAGSSPPVAANGAGAGSGNPAFVPRNVQAYPSPSNPGSTVVAWDRPDADSAGSGSAVAKYEIWSAGPDGAPGRMLGSAPPNATSIALSSAAFAGAGAGALILVRALGPQGQAGMSPPVAAASRNAPSNLRVTNVSTGLFGGTSGTLAWNHPLSGPPASYQVMQNGKVVDTVPGSQTSLEVSGIARDADGPNEFAVVPVFPGGMAGEASPLLRYRYSDMKPEAASASLYERTVRM
eukprot:tig00000131_g7474.t1